MLEQEVIVAPITGPFAAAVAVVRASGRGSWALVDSVFSKRPSHSNIATFGHLLERGLPFDEGYLTFFETGRSYTGEESFELSCHGSPAIVRRLLNELIRLGARMARPGEFTERAFLNGRIDLTQAEAVRETIEARTEAQQTRAQHLREGKLHRQLSEIENEIAGVLALAEATVDFSEEIGELDRAQTILELSAIIDKLELLSDSAKIAKIVREGIRIAIVGRPNVGKSSLMNALLGNDRAIVTSIPGTTRDTIEESLVANEVVLVITDTAGIRESKDEIEAQGIVRSKKAIEQADQIWFVYDGSAGWTEADNLLFKSLPRKPELIVQNKCDLQIIANAESMPEQIAKVSALTGMGVIEMLESVTDDALQNMSEIPLINQRHIEEISIAIRSLRQAKETLQSDLPTDLACIDLRGALEAVGRTTGTSFSDDILETIFKEFCIGK